MCAAVVFLRRALCCHAVPCVLLLLLATCNVLYYEATFCNVLRREDRNGNVEYI